MSSLSRVRLPTIRSVIESGNWFAAMQGPTGANTYPLKNGNVSSHVMTIFDSSENDEDVVQDSTGTINDEDARRGAVDPNADIIQTNTKVAVNIPRRGTFSTIVSGKAITALTNLVRKMVPVKNVDSLLRKTRAK